MSSKCIAIIDDDVDLLDLFKEALLMDGYENVYIFADPMKALNYIKKKPNDFGLVISDFKMPFINGCELCTRLRKFNPNLHFIIISAYDYILDDSSDFILIKKPIPIPQFLKIVKENITKQQIPKTHQAQKLVRKYNITYN